MKNPLYILGFFLRCRFIFFITPRQPNKNPPSPSPQKTPTQIVGLVSLFSKKTSGFLKTELEPPSKLGVYIFNKNEDIAKF